MDLSPPFDVSARSPDVTRETMERGGSISGDEEAEGGVDGACVVARSIPHVGGGQCRVRFIQDDFFCPVFSVKNSPVAYTLLVEGPYSIRLDTDISAPIIAKVEVDGKMFSNEFRIFPRGSRIVKEVNEPYVATTRSFVYTSPIVYDNVLQREVEPEEIDLCSVEEADDFTSLFRILFLPVKGGREATRAGNWRINYTRESLAVAMVRVGHRAPLAKLFGIQLTSLVKMLRQSSLGRPSASSRSVSLLSHPTRAASQSSRPRRSTREDSLFAPRSGSSTSRRWKSRSNSMENGKLHPSLSLTNFLGNVSGARGHVAGLTSSRRRRCPSPLRAAAQSAGIHVKSSQSSMREADDALGASPKSPLSPSVLRVKPMSRTNSPAPQHLFSNGKSHSFAPVCGRIEESPSVSHSNNESVACNEKDGSETQPRSSHSCRICVDCNAAFDRERLTYNKMILRLKERIFSLEQKNTELKKSLQIESSLCASHRGIR